MTTKKKFSERLKIVRSATPGSQTAYRNGQIPVVSNDISCWDNYDRYFKFYSIYVDDEASRAG